MNLRGRYDLVSSTTLRVVLRLLERSGLASVRPHIVAIRIELLNRQCEADAELTSWVQQPRVEA